MLGRIFFFLLVTISLPPVFLQNPRGGSVKGGATLIQKACKSTKYYDLRVSSLKSDPNSTKADTKGLASIMIGVATANAAAISSFLSYMVVNVVNDPVMAKLLKECAVKYSLAGDALQASDQDLTMEYYDYAYVQVMAAQDYPNACHNSFRRNAGLAYPPELAHKEDCLKHICDIILGILDFLGF